jgi:hypothetical protein
MLETEQEVAELVRDAMRDIGLDRRAHIEFNPLIPDSVGKTEGTHGPIVWEEPPHWMINFTYPADDDNATTRKIKVNTSEFQNLDEIRRSIAEKIRP